MTDLLEVCRGVVAQVLPGEAIEAYASRTQETEIDVVNGSVESLTVAGTMGIGVRVVVDHRQGFAWAGTLDADIVAEALAEARDNATFAEPDEWNGLADADDMAGNAADLDLWRDELLRVPTEDKVAFALELETRVRAADTRVRVESAGYGDGAMEGALASSAGAACNYRRTLASASVSALADDGRGTQSAYGFSAGRAFADIDADLITDMAIDRSTRLLGATQPKGARIPVILDPLVTASFLGVLSAAFNGESVLKGRSLFIDRVGEQVGSAMVTVVDDPIDARFLSAATHDSEGVPCRRNDLIVDGVLQGFLHNTYTARRAATDTTASAVRGGFRSTPGVGVRALRFAPGTKSAAEVLAAAPEALYVQAVHGIHSGTNPISGDFSVGAEGLMVRGGELREPVREITIASTIPRMLADITAVGADLTFLPGGAAGLTLLISEMTMSGS